MIPKELGEETAQDKAKPAEPQKLPLLRLKEPVPLICIKTTFGDFYTLRRLLNTAFEFGDRLLLEAPWYRYVIFQHGKRKNIHYYIFDGCTCNVSRFRYFDLAADKSGLKLFRNVPEMYKWLIKSRERGGYMHFKPKLKLDQFCYKCSL